MLSCPLPRSRIGHAVAAFGLGMTAVITTPQALASSHREAPFIAMNPSVDATDLYMFRSYETGRSAFVTILANYQPLQSPQGGPNFFMFNPAALYEIHMTFIIDLVKGGRRTSNRSSVTNAAGGATEFDKPVDNIGDKTFGSPKAYATYPNQHIYNVTIPGCSTPGRVFVGQRKEPFYIAVGKAIDLFNLNPLGAEVGGDNNDLEDRSVSSLAMEIPIACLTAGSEPVIGAFTTASLRQGRVLDGAPNSGLNKVARSGGA